MTHQERRHRRSAVRSEALALLLDACRARTGFDAVVIADTQGMLLSSSTRAGLDAEDIAAHLPRTHLRERVPSLYARTFKVGSVRLFLGAVGAMSERLLGDVLSTMRGTQRILG